jgi:hypothetical protein
VLHTARAFVTLLAPLQSCWKLSGRPAITDKHPPRQHTNTISTLSTSSENPIYGIATLQPPTTPTSSLIKATMASLMRSGMPSSEPGYSFAQAPHTAAGGARQHGFYP